MKIKLIKVMKTLLAGLAAASIVIFGSGIVTAQSGDFNVNIIGPGNFSSQRNIKLGYVVNGSGIRDKIAVKLWQNDKLVRSEFTSAEDGNSGSFTVTVPNDGTYSYYYTASAGENNAKSDIQKVTVDATPPEAAVYEGVTKNGNTYTIQFVAPNDKDLAEVRVFGSSSQSFTANQSSQVGAIAAKPSQEVTYTFTAPDSKNRFVAIQSFDKAGNGSDITGDPNAVVARGATSQTYQLSASGGASSGRVDAEGRSSTNINTNAADVLSDGSADLDKSVAGASDSWIAWVIIAALAAASIGYASRAKLAVLYVRLKSNNK